uniref:NB-ARC domain-containing protein n=1 Tax=Chenopodium quinoa TaxID=63459 RepID=A0A803LIQ9_CHEQI
MDPLQSELQVQLGGKKYFLVLHDCWSADRYKWLDLRKFLILGGRGSRVVVTTRSKMTANIIGSEHNTCELKGLFKEDSWRLFEMTSFGMEHNLIYPLELVDIGEKIIEKCYNAALAIKVVESLLFGQDTSKWRSFQKSVGNEDIYGKQCVGQLEDLKALKNLRGDVDISIYASGLDIKENDSEEGYLKSMEHLKGESLTFKGCHLPEKDYGPAATYHEFVLKIPEPHSNLKSLKLSGFQGMNIPSWGREWTTFFPNIVKINLEYTHNLQILPSLSNLYLLKSLELIRLRNLEFIKDISSISGNAAGLTFFPSLEFLEIMDLSKLKGWWRDEEFIADHVIDSSKSLKPSFPRLSILAINNCCNLTSFPPCPILEQLCLIGLNKTLRIRLGQDDVGLVSSLSNSTLSDTGSSPPKLRHVAFDDMPYFNTIPVERLTSMCIRKALELKCLSEVGELFKRCSSLRKLVFLVASTLGVF